MDSIEAFVKDTGAQLWIQHGKEQSATIKHSPHAYHWDNETDLYV